MPLSGLYLIGLTGNIACGKSTVLQMLAALGARVIDADRVTHELQQPGEPVYQQIVATFGEGILTTTGGPIDRRALGAIVFSDPARLQELERIIHPAVHARILAWLDSLGARVLGTGAGESEAIEAVRQPTVPPAHSLYLRDPRVAVIDAVKLLEAGWRPMLDTVWVVTCTPEQQLARLVATRGMTEDEARARIAAQPPQAAKVDQADVVIDNSGGLDETRRQVEAAWHSIQGAASGSRDGRTEHSRS